VTAPSQILTDADVVKIRDRVISVERSASEFVENPPVFQDCGGGPSRPSSGIVYP